MKTNPEKCPFPLFALDANGKRWPVHVESYHEGKGKAKKKKYILVGTFGAVGFNVPIVLVGVESTDAWVGLIKSHGWLNCRAEAQ